MSPEKLAFINLVARLGLDSAAIIWRTINSSPTVDDAITALEKSANKPWEQFKVG